MQSIELTDELISICVFPGRTYLKNWYSWEYIGEQALLFFAGGILHIQAPTPTHRVARIIRLRAADLLYVRLSLQLMYGRLELVDDCLSRAVVEFNAAGFDILQRSVQDLLGSSCPGNSIFTRDPPSAKTVLSELGKLSFKFKNGLVLYGLLPEEHLLGFVFQPGLRGRRWHLFPSRISEPTLLALTDKQLIIVEEQSRSRFPAYGWIFTFCPRRVIEKIGVTSGEPFQELIVDMKSKVGLIDWRILLDQEHASVWRGLWLRFADHRLAI
jgi:hypothetical protein